MVSQKCLPPSLPSYMTPFMNSPLPGSSFLEIEEAEAVDDADHRVVQPLLPGRLTEVRVLPDHPPGHHHPVSDCLKRMSLVTLHLQNCNLQL